MKSFKSRKFYATEIKAVCFCAIFLYSGFLFDHATGAEMSDISICNKIKNEYSNIFKSGNGDALPFPRVGDDLSKTILKENKTVCTLYDSYGKSLASHSYSFYLMSYDHQNEKLYFILSTGGFLGGDDVIWGPVVIK